MDISLHPEYEIIADKIEELLSDEGDLRWLYLALVRSKPAPQVLTNDPTQLQILALNICTKIFVDETPKK